MYDAHAAAPQQPEPPNKRRRQQHDGADAVHRRAQLQDQAAPHLPAHAADRLQGRLQPRQRAPADGIAPGQGASQRQLPGQQHATDGAVAPQVLLIFHTVPCILKP